MDYEDRGAPGGDDAGAAAADGAAGAGAGAPGPGRRRRVRTLVKRLIDAIMQSDDDAVERAVRQLSATHRWLAPLALIVGAFLMLFQGVKLLVTNWRLTLVQILPAMWIWVAMLDIKVHVLHTKGFNILRGPILLVAIAGVLALTMGSFYLNGVFAFAIAARGKPEIRPAFAKANQHVRTILAWGGAIGLALAFSALISTRWGGWSFVISQSIVVGIMMLCYLAVPARIVGIDTKKDRSRRDALAATAVGGAVGAVICSPPYMLGRFGILMLGWHYLFWLGVILIVIGAALQTGVTSAVKAVKFSAKLVGHPATAATVAASPAPEA
ncbi:MAG TPA: twin-arginine translocation signal domain-containing protein [Acidimicrobiales bacterium]|nr:twin-arginine translocation signal domain-containing protein [Acidimicrobiales bacterium]